MRAAPAREQLLARYPTDTVSIDLHVVPLRWGDDAQSRATRDAAAAFGSWLTGADGKQALLAVGLRPTGRGTDLAAPLDEKHGVRVGWPFGHPVDDAPTAEARTAALDTYTRARRPGRVLLAIDASGSMNETTDAQGTTRFGVALRGATASLAHMYDQRDELGLWLFSTSAGPSGVLPVLPIVGSTTTARGVLGTAQWHPTGDTPLDQAMAAGVPAVGARADNAVNALAVPTHGQDTASGEWLDDVEREIAAHPHVRIFLITIGDASCGAGELVRLVVASAGQCLPTTAGTVDQTLTTLFRILWTKG